MLRLFTAIELPAGHRELLASLCTGIKDARWVEAHNLHLTLSFIGEVDEGAAEDLHKSLQNVKFDSFTLSLAEIDCFESRGKVRIMWAGVQHDRVSLCHLQNKVASAIEMSGLDFERRKYKPHVTLARFRAMRKEKILDYISANNSLKTDPFEVMHFSLFRSHLTHHGPEYEVLERYPFTDEI